MSKNIKRLVTNHTKSEQENTLAKTSTARLVRAEVIAEALDVNKRTVCLWAQNGKIPCVRIAGTVRFDMDAVIKATR